MDQVAKFYTGSGGLVAAIGAALDAAGVDRARLRPSDLAPVDEFHIRGRAASLEIIDALDITAGSHVLDLGSGLGGPARTIAEVAGSRVTGVDLTPEFCEAATALSSWTGLADRTHFRVGDATATGLADAGVDAALTVHVAMNIPDKPALYAEARCGCESCSARQASRSSRRSTPRMTASCGSRRCATGSDEKDHRRSRSRPSSGRAFGQMAANQVTNLAERRIRTVMYTCVRPL